MIRSFIRNKRGDEQLIYAPVIFIILNIVFFSTVLIFISRASYGSMVYEQSYAKEIALALDQSKPGMTLNFDMQKLVDNAREAQELGDEIKNEAILTRAVRVDNKKNLVIVSLTSKGGYSMQYFSDFDVDVQVRGSYLTLITKERAVA